MKVSEILDMWKKDSKIDSLDLGEEALRSPALHAKYLSFLAQAKSARQKIYMEHKVAKRDAWLYYTGKAEAAKYAERPFELKLLKGEVPPFVEADSDLQRSEARLAHADHLIYTLEQILGQVRGRDWQIRNAIEFQKHLVGV